MKVVLSVRPEPLPEEDVRVGRKIYLLPKNARRVRRMWWEFKGSRETSGTGVGDGRYEIACWPKNLEDVALLRKIVRIKNNGRLWYRVVSVE